MESRTRRYIEDGREYDELFPIAKLTDSTVKRGASVGDTVKFIPKAVRLTKGQTAKLAQLLKGESRYITCRNIWDFVYNHIRYHKDAEGREQIRSPARSWHDRERGVDCDCYTVFISTILSNLAIPHVLRITKYGKDYYQHIYPIVPTKAGHITIDCVVDSFNYEQPFSEKQDTPMDLQFLEGLDDEKENSQTGRNLDSTIGEEHEELGRKKLFEKGWFKNVTKDISRQLNLHNINRFNPATVALRMGVLASMKLNLFKVPQRLKYAYLTEAQAKARGVDMNKWKQLVSIKNKIEQIFYGAGGSTSNFKKAIVTGEGNRNHDVSGVGLGYIYDEGVAHMNVNTPLHTILGKEMYESETKIGGLGDLGDPITGATIAAATGVIGVISELIKKIGSIFPPKDKAASDFQTTPQDDAASADAAKGASAADKALVENAPSSAGAVDTAGDAGNEGDGQKQSFFQKNKKPITIAAIGTAAAGIIFGIVKLLQADNKGAGKEKKKEEAVAGIKSKHHKLKPLQLK